jgi:prepilin-type N-terminal cleavage/methylation domain-containing protein
MRKVSSARGQRGVTLIEMLVVVALFGLIALIGTIQINKTWQRYRLEGTSNEIRGFLQSAFTQAGQLRTAVFVRFVPANGGASPLFQITNDANGTTVLSSYTVPDFVSFSTTDPSALDGCNWPCASGPCGATDPRILQVNPLGRTMQADGTAVTQTETLLVTHKDMVSGLLTPRTSYTMEIFPIWQVLTERGLF